MARNDGRIEPGQKLSTAISARAWNRAQQAADVVLGAGVGITAPGSQYAPSPYVALYAKNTSGSDAERWSVLQISGLEVTPSMAVDSDFASFEQMPILTCGALDSPMAAWCVAVEPIPVGKVGRVAVAGVVQIKAGDIPKAIGASVLWKHTVYSAWALIRIDNGRALVTFSGAWPIGTSKMVTVTGTSVDIEVSNSVVDVGVDCGERNGIVMMVNDGWYLVSAERR